MSAVRTTIDIAVPAQEIWDFVMDPTNASEWVTIHRGDKRHDDGPLVVGYTMTQRLCLRGVPFDVEWRLAEVDAPWHAVWEGKGPARSRARIVDDLTEDGGITRFDYENEFKAPLGPLGAVAARTVTGGIPEREANASLRQLKHILESRR